MDDFREPEIVIQQDAHFAKRPGSKSITDNQNQPTSAKDERPYRHQISNQKLIKKKGYGA